MKKIIASILVLFFIISSSSIVISINVKISKEKNNVSNDFYFVQITDTHVINEEFEYNKTSQKRLNTVINKILLFPKKPDFIVITGDLVEWGGSDLTGEMNYKSFKKCFYEKDGELYIDKNYSIPVYTTPGNHDYLFTSSLKNYKDNINKNLRYVLSHQNLCLIFIDSGSNYIRDPFDWIRVKGNGLFLDDINWVEEKLSMCTDRHKIILMHHPAVNRKDEFGEMSSIIARNRENFVNICEQNNVELVLSGHTHTSRVYDKNINEYSQYPINCSLYPTLYVQSQDCKKDVYYRNISIFNDHIFLEENIELNFSNNKKKDIKLFEKEFNLRNNLEENRIFFLFFKYNILFKENSIIFFIRQLL